MLGTLALAAWLHAQAPDAYRRGVQEDEALEWATFWAFALASAAYAVAARRAWRPERAWPWFFAGLAAFCAFVAGEEISWGQRLLGYRPPVYFLANNFQQELNLHNIVEGDLRKLAFLVVVLGYGAVLPLLVRVPAVARISDRVGIVPPPLAFVPAFAATGILYHLYPWSHTGEWAEAMLGLGLLCVGLREAGHGSGRRLAMAGAVVLALGFGTTQLWWAMTSDDPHRRELAEAELAALRQDLSTARTRTRCGLHKRVYSMVEKYDHDHVYEGEFAGRTALGLPVERARFFLDPWNSPYWILHECSSDRRKRAIFVYSFGPNRRRDSGDWEIRPDDLGAWISRPRSDPWK